MVCEKISHYATPIYGIELTMYLYQTESYHELSTMLYEILCKAAMPNIKSFLRFSTLITKFQIFNTNIHKVDQVNVI